MSELETSAKSAMVHADITDPARPWREQDAWRLRVVVDGVRLADGETFTIFGREYVAGALVTRQRDGTLG